MHSRFLRFILVLAAAVLLVAPARSQQIGLQGGFNRAGIGGDAPSGTQYSGATGFMAGLVADLPVARDVFLSIQPMYARRGTGIAFAIPGEEQPRDSLDVTLTYVSVPVLARVQAAHGRTFVTGGVDAGILLDATLSGRGPDEDIKAVFKNLDVAAVFGFGVVFPLGAPRLTVEARYSQSLVNLSAGGTAPSGVALPERFRTSGFQVLAGLMLRLGGR